VSRFAVAFQWGSFHIHSEENLLFVSVGHVVLAYSIPEGKLLRTFQDERDLSREEITTISYCEDTSKVAFGTMGGSVTIWGL
jgi:hypothetical protein